MNISRKSLRSIIKEEMSRLQKEGMFDDIVDTPSSVAVPVKATIDLTALGLGVQPIKIKVIDETRSFGNDLLQIFVGNAKFYMSGPKLDDFRLGMTVTLDTYLAEGTSGSASVLERASTPIAFMKI